MLILVKLVASLFLTFFSDTLAAVLLNIKIIVLRETLRLKIAGRKKSIKNARDFA